MRILILSSARTGSNYLRNVLYRYSAKRTKLYDEPFRDEKFPIDAPQEKYLKKIIKTCIVNENIVCKVHLDQLYKIKNPKHFDFFLNDERWYKILLLRKDLFRSTFSYVVADILENFNEKDYLKTDILIDENKFLAILENKILYWTKFSELKKANNYNKIVYFEDFTFDLDLDYKNLNLPLRKTPQNKIYINEKTPYDIINVLNVANLEEIFNKRMSTFVYNGIKNNNGILELE